MFDSRNPIVTRIEGKEPSLYGCVEATGERFPAVRIRHNGDNGAQSVGQSIVEEVAEEFGMSVEVQKYGDVEDIYIKPNQGSTPCNSSNF